MTLKIGTESVRDLKIGNQLVDIVKIGTEIAYRRTIEPALYVLHGNSLVVVNPTSREHTVVGAIRQANGDRIEVHRLEWHRGQLYSISLNRDALYKIDRTLTTITLSQGRDKIDVLVATGLGPSWRPTEDTPLDIASDGTNMYMVGFDSAVLNRVDISTGAITALGSRGFGVGELIPIGLAYDGTTMFMAGATHGLLYTVNTTTGAARRVGRTAFGLATAGDTGPFYQAIRFLGWDGQNLVAIISVHDRPLSAVYNDVFTIDRTTGIATAGYNLTAERIVLAGTFEGLTYFAGR